VTGIAIVGTGMWAPRLASAGQRAGLDVVTCFSRDDERRRAFAERFGCRPARTFEDAVGDPDVEAVILATPNDVHAEQACACAALGRHVFVEKPIADTVEAGERIRDACVAAGVVVMVGHAFRRLGAARAAAELVSSGRLGRVVLAEADFSLTGRFPPEAWRAHRERNPGGPLMQLGIHHADTLAAWLGPVRSAAAAMAHVHTDADIDDVGVATLAFESGALAALTGSYVSPPTFSLRLLGTEAVLDYRADIGRVWPDATRVDEVTTLTVDGETVAFEPRDMLAEQLAELAAAIRGDAVVETGAAEGIAALRVILDAVRCAGARTSACCSGARATSTTSRSTAWCTWRSCAARTRTRVSRAFADRTRRRDSSRSSPRRTSPQIWRRSRCRRPRARRSPTRRTRSWRSTRSATRGSRWPPWSRRAARSPRMWPSWSRSTTSRST
jgi:predicted dehydrogenase